MFLPRSAGQRRAVFMAVYAVFHLMLMLLDAIPCILSSVKGVLMVVKVKWQFWCVLVIMAGFSGDRR